MFGPTGLAPPTVASVGDSTLIFSSCAKVDTSVPPLDGITASEMMGRISVRVPLMASSYLSTVVQANVANAFCLASCNPSPFKSPRRATFQPTDAAIVARISSTVGATPSLSKSSSRSLVFVSGKPSVMVPGNFLPVPSSRMSARPAACELSLTFVTTNWKVSGPSLRTSLATPTRTKN